MGSRAWRKLRRLAHKHLALDLEADGEEEYGHEGVVDEGHDAHRLAMMAEEVEAPHLESYLCVQRLL